MRVIIVGGGKVGYYLTKTLLEHGHKATLIEISKMLCKKIANELDIQVICGDGTIEETLICADAHKSDAVISVTGRDENNLIACQIAKSKFNSIKTIARVNNPKNSTILKTLGVDVVVSTTSALVHIIERETDNSIIKQLLSIDRGEATINQITVNKSFKYIGKKLKDIPLPNGIIIATIHRNNELIVPNGETDILENDKVLVVSQNKQVHKLTKMFT